MDIQVRNQDIVSRHANGETLTAIGKAYGISRERARQIFDEGATKADRASAKRAAQKPPKPTSLIAPKGEARVRVNVPNGRNTDISQRVVRAGIARWLKGDLAINSDAKGTKRFGPVMSQAMFAELSAKCETENLAVTTAVRGIICALEKEMQE